MVVVCGFREHVAEHVGLVVFAADESGRVPNKEPLLSGGSNEHLVRKAGVRDGSRALVRFNQGMVGGPPGRD